MKRIKTLIISIICIYILNMNNSVSAIVSIEGNPSSLGKNNPCGQTSAYIACYEPKFEFRITLVDQNGKKVDGTKSIEYGREFDYYGTITRKTKEVNYTVQQKNNFIDPQRFSYKYSDEFDDYNLISDHTYYITNLVDNLYISKTTYKDDPGQYEAFTNEFIGYVKNTNAKRFGIDDGSTGEYNFLTMFLYHCGYLNKNETGGKYFDINDATNEYIIGQKYNIAEKNYYLLIEPLYTIFYNETKYGNVEYKYGTAKEIGNYLYKKADGNSQKMSEGYLAGLTLVFTYNMGSNLYTQPDSIYKEEPINEQFRQGKLQNININDLNRYKASYITGELVTRYNRIGKWKEIANKDYGYGVSILKLKNSILEEPYGTTQTYNFSFNRCNDKENISDGKISFSSDLITYPLPFTYDESYFEKNDRNDGNGTTIYCYDNFDYDFNNIIEELNSTENKPKIYLSKIDIPKGKLTVNRYCYIKDWNKYTNGTQKTEFIEKYDMYYNKKIKVNLFGETIELEGELNPKTITTDDDINKNNFILKPKKTKGIYLGEAIIHSSATIDFVYKNATGNSQYTITKEIKKNENYESSIDLSNISYGYSTNLINELAKGNITYSKTELAFGKEQKKTYNLLLKTSGNSNTCPFTTYVNNGGNTPPTPEAPVDPLEERIKFRVISLENPFPARDASSRMPGKNWLGNNNYIRGYITNNRGVKEEEVYDKDPIYVIDLTPSTMIKIREYNKSHSYSDIVLNCSEKTKTECTSEFLRNKKYFEQDKTIGGLCINPNASQTNIIKDITIENLNDKLQNMKDDIFIQENTYESKYDLNKDGRITKEDAAIFQQIDKTTSYYTCADKTYESSGYLGRGEN